ncbi:MAG TPA: ChaN family lipoprotein [Planctomycetota bacterium]|nr:ChaN family lipoprotein [Planctomycetota bacterium]
MRLFALALLAACAVAPKAPEAPSYFLVADERSGRAVAMDNLLDELVKNDVVFLGETHLDDNTHRFELETYEGLAGRRKVVLAFEMFERDVQPALDDYLEGRIDEKTFFERARPWQNYRSGYRALIEAAKRRGLPVVASNAPGPVLRKLSAEGGGLDKLAPEDRALLPAEIYDGTDDYWERVARATRGHMGTGGDRVTSVQNLWDNTMGDSCARALRQYPGALVLHVNGGFHSAYRGGAAYQLLKRKPDARVAVVEIATVNDFAGLEPFGAPERADYVAFVLGRARGPQDGFHAVTVFPELRYRLHLPHGLTEGKTPPLLVWLGGDGFRAADALAPLAEELGDEVAIAAVEPPYPMLADDLAPGGRWFTGETFDDDLGFLGSGLARIVGYVLRNYPVDGTRVVLAGEGTGATVVAATSLYERDLALPAFAIGPARFGKLRMLGLPGSEGASGARRLSVTVRDADLEWWTKEAEAWEGTGLPVEVAKGTRAQAMAEVRASLGLSPAKKEGAWTGLLLVHDTPRARLWADTYVMRLPGPADVVDTAETQEGARLQPLAFEGESVPEGLGILPPFPIESLMDGKGLPLAAGPFGGTTILVVPADTTEEQRAAWKKLEETDAIKKKSRFARLVVLTAKPKDEGPAQTTGLAVEGLPAALQAVKDAGRSVVLVVPAVFCADAGMMAEIRAVARPYEDILDLSYLPGLGGEVRPPEPAPK